MDDQTRKELMELIQPGTLENGFRETGLFQLVETGFIDDHGSLNRKRELLVQGEVIDREGFQYKVVKSPGGHWLYRKSMNPQIGEIEKMSARDFALGLNDWAKEAAAESEAAMQENLKWLFTGAATDPRLAPLDEAPAPAYDPSTVPVSDKPFNKEEFDAELKVLEDKVDAMEREFTDPRLLVKFLWLLLRDTVPFGRVETVLKDLEKNLDQAGVYDDEHMFRYVQSLANRLTK